MAEPLYRANVLVCGGTGCTASGSLAVREAMAEELERRGLADEVRLNVYLCLTQEPFLVKTTIWTTVRS